jgi:hypothetical protein
MTQLIIRKVEGEVIYIPILELKRGQVKINGVALTKVFHFQTATVLLKVKLAKVNMHVVMSCRSQVHVYA